MAAKKHTLEAAFTRFVELVKPIEDVYYAAAFEPRRPDIYTYIKTMDRDVMLLAIQAQRVIDEEFPDLLIGFHVVFLEGRPIESFVRPFPELFYSRQTVAIKSGNSG